MATLHLTAATTVADLRKEFNEAFGSQVKVYIGNKGADMSATLSQAGLTKSGEMDCANTMTVDTFIATCKNDWGLKVKVYTCDEWVAVLDALTLEQSGQVKKAATKADMEKMVGIPSTEITQHATQSSGADIYSRHAALGKEFNDFWQQALHTNENLFAQMKIEDFVGLKKAISNINNIVTLLVTDGFIDFLQSNKIISTKQTEQMHQDINQTHANTNGFDVECDGPVKIVAEVKCNIPVEDTAFGAAQEESIMDDILHLTTSKSKSKLSQEQIKDYYKFMVLLDCEHVPECTRKIIGKMKKWEEYKNIMVEEYAPNTTMQTDKVYVVYINSK